MSVTNSRTDCCLVDLIDATLAVEDVKSKPVDVDAFADVKRVLKMGLKVTADSWATTSQVPLQLDNSF